VKAQQARGELVPSATKAVIAQVAQQHPDILQQKRQPKDKKAQCGVAGVGAGAYLARDAVGSFNTEAPPIFVEDLL